MRLRCSTLLFVALFATVQLFAQDKPAEKPDGWERGSSLGLNLDQLLLHNPRVGAGQNRIGIGGMAGWYAKLKKGMLSWDNNASLNLNVQRLGAGVIAGSSAKVPFTKNVDDLRFNSKLGYKFKATSKWSYAADFSVLTQLLPTYPGALLRRPSTGETAALSKFFAPGFVTLALGTDYKPNDKLSIFISPLAYKGNIVTDDAIAKTGAYGNEVRTPSDYDKAFHQMGAMARGVYTNKFFKEKFVFKSNLALFSNYMKEPQNIDVDWTNEFGYTIVKGLQLALFTNIWYDHDVQVYTSDYSQVGGLKLGPDGKPALSRNTSFTENFVIKYNITF